LRIFVKTFGCRSNLYDSEIIKNILGAKVVNSEMEADFIIVNSCTVTNFADRDLRRYLNRWNNKNIMLTGCAAYTLGEELFNSGRVQSVLGHKYKEEIDRYLDFNGVKLGNFDFVNKKIITSFSKTKAFIKIQEGCDFECAYCIIPSVRGHSRSLDEKTILNQIETLSQNGISEFVLTGINMGSYGKDTGTTLADLVEKISKIRGVKRIRLGSLEPSQLNDKLIDLTKNGILERHLHIALQHTSDRMLRIMKRRNRVKPTLELFEKLAEEKIALGTDFIVGHPGESDEIWNEALDNFKKYPLTHIHVFRFTPRDGTYSAELKQDVRGDVAKKRAKIIEEIVRKNNYNFRMENKVPLVVHVENYKKGCYEGYDQFYNKMLIKSGQNIKGGWITFEEYEIKDVNYAKIQ
jgi:MiaB-like tRNA modifying enzyme